MHVFKMTRCVALETHRTTTKANTSNKSYRPTSTGPLPEACERVTMAVKCSAQRVSVLGTSSTVGHVLYTLVMHVTHGHRSQIVQ